MTETLCHTTVASDRKLVVSLVVGKRTREQTHTLLQDTKRRLRQGHLPTLFTNTYENYESAILEAESLPVRSQLMKVSQVRCMALHCYATAYSVLPTMGAVSLFQGSMIFSLISHWPSTLTQVST